jgi:hypothetical protein
VTQNNGEFNTARWQVSDTQMIEKGPEHTDRCVQYEIKNDVMAYLLASQHVGSHLEQNPTAAALMLF